MNRLVVCVALGLSAILLQSCASTPTPAIPQSPGAAAQSAAGFPVQAGLITKQQAEKIARKALHQWCQCNYMRLRGATLEKNPPRWDVEFGMMMCDVHVWVNAQNGKVIRIRRRC